MKRSTKLKKKERSTIAMMLAQGESIREIGRRLTRSPSSISEEIERHKTWDGDTHPVPCTS
ncbi:MAG: helix-turn-helix domain-containing protein [Candidatus Roizmanbacteria bacterium]